MSNMVLNVSFVAGTSIVDAVIEAKHQIVMLDVAGIEFNFNGVKVYVGYNNMTEEEVQDKWYKSLSDNKDYVYF